MVDMLHRITAEKIAPSSIYDALTTIDSLVR